MKRQATSSRRGYTLIELMFATGLMGVVALVIFSLLNIGTILGAKNTAVNVAHQNARIAMLQMTADFHSAISPLTLVDDTGTALPVLQDAQGQDIPNNGPAAGISFQLMAGGPYRIVKSAVVGATVVRLSAGTKPTVGERLIIHSHAIEESITAVSKVSNGVFDLTLGNAITTAINYDPTEYITGIITDRCSYIVVNKALQWTGPTTKKSFVVLGNDITSPQPFTTPQTLAGAPDERVVAAIDLSTADSHYSNRGFKSANILLSGQVPLRARLTDQQ